VNARYLRGHYEITKLILIQLHAQDPRTCIIQGVDSGVNSARLLVFPKRNGFENFFRSVDQIRLPLLKIFLAYPGRCSLHYKLIRVC
jgi:hypothetical protein